MTTENKYRVIHGLKVFGLFIWAVITIAVCYYVWNDKPGAFYSILAGVLFFANALAIVSLFRSFKKQDEENLKTLYSNSPEEK